MTPRAGAPDEAAAAVSATAAAAPDWATLAAAARGCTACPELVATRRTVVVGSAPAGARVVVVGEAPGAQEDETGEPFVGRSGQLLDRLLAEVGLPRPSVAVLNTLKCRPPANRPPKPLETAHCRGWAERQLALLAPAVVVALGLSATRWFLGPVEGRSLAPVRGRVHEVLGLRVLPTYHPSAAIRFGPQGEPLRLLREDLALAAQLGGHVTVVRSGAVTGRLVDRGLSWEVRDLSGPPDRAWVDAAVAAAAAGGALDLRVTAEPGSAPWTGLGFAPLEAGHPELVLPVTLLLEGVEQTRELGVRLAAALRPGDLLVLSGPLGAGKTALTQGIGSALGVRGAVTSPTFVLARSHRGPLPLVHVDAYRLRDSGADALALADLDLEASLEDSVVVVEWGRGLVEDLADAWLDVELGREGELLADGTAERRSVRVRAHGRRWALPGG